MTDDDRAEKPGLNHSEKTRLTRAQAAKILGVSVQGVRDLEFRNLLDPKMYGGRITFARKDVERLKEKREAERLHRTQELEARRKLEVVTPELFQAVARGLRSGKALIDVALEVAATPDQIFSCVYSYERMVDAMFLPGDVVRQIRPQPMAPPANANELLQDLVYMKQLIAELRKKESTHGG